MTDTWELLEQATRTARMAALKEVCIEGCLLCVDSQLSVLDEQTGIFRHVSGEPCAEQMARRLLHECCLEQARKDAVIARFLRGLNGVDPDHADPGAKP